MTRGLALALTVEAFILAALMTLAVDQYAHAQVERLDGINARGYRGAVARQRVADETRLLMVGGTRAFQPGVALADTTAMRLRHMVEQWVTLDRGPVTAVNLALAGAPRGSYARRLEAFRELAPDVICIYLDLTPATRAPEPGLVQRLTGYVPAQRAFVALDRQLGGMLDAIPAASDDIREAAAAVDTALSIAGGVVVAIPEPASDGQRLERDALLAALERFAGDQRVTIVQLTDGPPGLVGGVEQPADAIQIEPALSALLRARTQS